MQLILGNFCIYKIPNNDEEDKNKVIEKNMIK